MPVSNGTPLLRAGRARAAERFAGSLGSNSFIHPPNAALSLTLPAEELSEM